MIERLIRFSLDHRRLVLLAAAALLVGGGLWARRTPVDVLPDLASPTVSVVTEATGMAPEEVEQLVTFPIESALGGTPGLRRQRSMSAAGISVVKAEFFWGTDIYRARQLVAERLGGVALPAQVEPPQLGPASSIMGEIAFVALTSDTVSALELRRLADLEVRRRLLAIGGVSQVVAIGGEIRQIQVQVHPQALLQYGTSLRAVVDAAAAASRQPAAGFHVDSGDEYLVRGLTRIESAEELASTVIETRQGIPIRIGDVATVKIGATPSRGTAAYKARTAVVLSIQKELQANTLAITEELDRVLAELASSLPEGVHIEPESFRQADFIERAISHVWKALRDGAFLVVVILFLFLGNLRTTLISTLAIPLSLVMGILVVAWSGGTLNTMTLGGLTIAIGALVDDAIIDVENVFRRLRQNRQRPKKERLPALRVIFQGSMEVRRAIFFATVVLVLVLLPLFFLPGMEGRLLRPLALAYIAALVASLLVSMTVTPVLCSFLLRGNLLERREPLVLRLLQRIYRPVLELALARPWLVVVAALVMLLGSAALLPTFGRSFLPPFNEGALTIGVSAPPGTSLADSQDLGGQVEAALLEFPEVLATSRRTGRAEKDEHVQGVNRSEIEVVLGPSERSKDELLAAMREAISGIPGVAVSFGQPISHRIDHMISGSRTNLAVKVFGPDLSVLRGLAGRIENVLQGVPGIVDLSNEEQASVPQLLIEPDRLAMSRHGLSPADLGVAIEALFQGTKVGEVVERGTVTGVVVRYPEALRSDRDQLALLPLSTPDGRLLRLGDVARLRFDLGPSLVRRENAERLAMISANVVGADLTGTVERARQAVEAAVELPPGYLVTYGGQFEEAERSTRHLAMLCALILGAMYVLLHMAFGRARSALIVLVNLPLAAIGGVAAVALGGGILSVATLVGFVTLFGIATRNGVLLVSHYQHLMASEGLPLADAVRRGSRERLAPILMTALTAGLALIPLVLAGGEPGNEIQSPMAEVILGGLLSSTFLNLLVVPALFARWGMESNP